MPKYGKALVSSTMQNAAPMAKSDTGESWAGAFISSAPSQLPVPVSALVYLVLKTSRSPATSRVAPPTAAAPYTCNG